MNATLLLALGFAVLLGLEWKYLLRSLRVGAASLALMVLWFTAPNYTAAVRHVIYAPPAERVTQLGEWTLSDYQSGVHTVVETMDEQAEAYADARLLGFGVLFWLACSPAVRRSSAQDAGSKDGRPTGDGE